MDMFKVKLTFEINYVWATELIFNTRTPVLVKVSKLLRQKMSPPQGDLTPNRWIHAEYPKCVYSGDETVHNKFSFF